MPYSTVASRQIRTGLLDLVRQIPHGRVSDIVELASALHIPVRQAVEIWTSLTRYELDLMPWYRVVPITGRLSAKLLGRAAGLEQIKLLVAEGHAYMSADHLWIAKQAFWRPPSDDHQGR